MKTIVKQIVSIIYVILLVMTQSCSNTIETESISINGWDGKTPYDHQINSYLSTDWDGDEITLFITDKEKSINFRSISGDSPNAEITDCFVCGNYIGESIGWNESYLQCIFVQPSHVGSTHLHIYNSKYDETMRIVILPEFNTFTEPSLDFDDTQDSVVLKLSSLQYTEDDGVFQVTDPHNDYSLTVNYSANGTVDSYEVTLENSVSSDELTGYVSERYYKTSGYFNGSPVYIKAFNVSMPSISDASFIVILDKDAKTITYQNPTTYGCRL